MPFKKGQPRPAKAGRKKNTPNAISGDVKAMVLQALSEVGGVEYLKGQAIVNSSSFMTLVGKVLPLTVAGDPNAPLNPVQPIIQFVRYGDTADAAANPPN